MSDKTEIVLTVKVKYTRNGVTVEALKDNLRHMVDWAIGEGMLTHDTEAEVDKYKVAIKSF